MNILAYDNIDRVEWSRLVETSATGTWFQGPEAYGFYESLPELFKPFVVAVINDANGDNGDATLNGGALRGVCVGYVTVEKSAYKQFFTRRAIIIGGPCLADDCREDEAYALMQAVRQRFRIFDLRFKILNSPIYIETRNFNDYSRWKGAFEKAGFEYKRHLNFHVNTSSVEVVDANLGKSRKRDIRTSLRDGATIVELNAGHLDAARLDPTDIEKKKADELRMLHEYYDILQNLYKTRVKTPLFPFSFFEKLWQHKDGRFILVVLNGEIIGGTVCVEQEGKCLYEWFACGRDGEWKTIFPSTLATYSGIRYAAEHGCARFDMMGAGKPDEAYGVRDFKAKFGGKEVEHGRFLCITKPVLYQIGKLGVAILKMRK